MKLAEALLLRADLQKRQAQIKARLLRNARVQQGDEPSEDPTQLLTEFDAVSAELETLIHRINRTNLTAEIESGDSLTAALAQRDVLRQRADAYRSLAQAASITQDRYSRSEVRFVSTVDVRAIQKQADALSRQLRELDTEIQATNWSYELME